MIKLTIQLIKLSLKDFDLCEKKR
uniref:Uncharacterized protein n=1 Tax=Tetranychus urticae TaxID=32264 RepID=T1K5E7_TETUR